MGNCCSTSNVKAPSDASSYLSEITGMSTSELKNASLNLDLSNGKHQEILSKLSKLKLPKFGSISLSKVIKEDIRLIDEFSLSVRQNLSIFSLSAMNTKISLDSEGLLKLARSVTESFTIKNFGLEKDYLAKVISAAFDCQKIVFKDCDFTGKSHFNIDSNRQYKITTIAFLSTNPKHKFGMDDLRGLMVRMAETSIKNSLETVIIGKLDEKDKVSVILNDYGFGKVYVQQEESDSD